MGKEDLDVARSESVVFAEAEKASNCIDVLTSPSSDREKGNEALSKLREIFDKYLELPSLLDRHLEAMVCSLAQSARSIMESIDIETLWESPLPRVFSALYALSKVRGRKRVQKFLPHEVKDVEIVLETLKVLDKVDGANPAGTRDSNGDPQLWESVYTLWNWMGILSLVPFDFSVVVDATRISDLIQLGKSHLSEAGPTREIAAACLASWLSRPDLEETEFKFFCQWSLRVLKDFASNGKDIFRTMGVIQTLVTILKVSTADRDTLLASHAPFCPILLEISDSVPSNLLLRRYLVKWWTRLGSIYLPPRVASWRYKRGRRSLKENLLGIDKKHQQDNKQSSKHDEQEEKCDDFFLVPDQVEEAMDQLIKALTDSFTNVRWSAAKGVGRITERLPELCAEDVLDAVLELFDDREKDNNWHGACLALAELGRRGLILPHRLPDVIPKIVEAINYDVPRRLTSVGAHVRDSSCYTYWAIARAYSPEILRPFVLQLSQSVTLAFLFDREVNCRRAASAAFQEFVGRQGTSNFKHGISILTKADYFSLGNRVDAYTSISLHVAQFEEYRRAMIDHLFKIKLCHWDPAVRLLTSKALNGLTSLDIDYMKSTVIPYLLENSMDQRNVQLRHGSVLGLAEIVLAFGSIKVLEERELETLLSSAQLTSIAELVPMIEKKRLYRGKGGEQMRAAVCRLIECIATTEIPLTVPQQVRLLDSIDACIPHPSEDIQEQACKALFRLMRSYFPVSAKGPTQRLQSRVVDKYVKQVKTSINPAATRGFSLALGHLPEKLLAPSTKTLDTCLATLCRTSRPDAKVGNDKDAETRRNSLVSLGRICKTVGIGRQYGKDECVVSLTAKQTGHVFAALFRGLNDYNMERRGDVGSMSRIVAMQGLEIMTLVTTNDPVFAKESFTEEICVQIIGGILKQLSEKLDAVRCEAGKCLVRILKQSEPVVPHIRQRERLLEALGLDCKNDSDRLSFNWADASRTFPIVIKALGISEYFDFVLSGLVISVGCLTQSVAKHASAVLLQWVKVAEERDIERLGKAFLDIFERHKGEGRVILPLLKTIALLMNRMSMEQLLHDQSFLSSLLSLLKEEEKLCKDVHRLTAIINVSLGLMGGSEKDKETLAFVCRMLRHPFPRIRRIAAENLYVRLLEDPELDENHPVLTLLLNNPWDGDESQAKVMEMAVAVATALDVGLLMDDVSKKELQGS